MNRLLLGAWMVGCAALLGGCDQADGTAGDPGSAETVDTSPVVPARADAAGDRESVEESRDWKQAKKQRTVEAFTNFIDAHPDGDLAEEAARRRRILDLEPISLSVEVAAPEGHFMVAAPPVLKSDGSIAPSSEVQSMPEGSTLVLQFSTTAGGEEVTEVIETTYYSATEQAMVFRNDDGICLTRAHRTGNVSYCDGEAPSPPDPSNTRGLMVYAWLVARFDSTE